MYYITPKIVCVFKKNQASSTCMIWDGFCLFVWWTTWYEGTTLFCWESESKTVSNSYGWLLRVFLFSTFCTTCIPSTVLCTSCSTRSSCTFYVLRSTYCTCSIPTCMYRHVHSTRYPATVLVLVYLLLVYVRASI